ASGTHAVGVIYNDLASVGQPTGTLYSTFDGQAVGLNDILIKYTYFGDADLSGFVTTNDYFNIDQGFLNPHANPSWINGDFNYDGTVDTNDYFVIDNAFLNQGNTVLSPTPASGASLAGVTAVPEPASLGVL